MTSIRICDYIHPLEQFGYLGQIHSVFRSSFNIQIGKQLVHVSSQSNFLSSFGLLIDSLEYQLCHPYLQVGNTVKPTEKGLVIYSRQGIHHLSGEWESINLKVDRIEVKKASDQLQLLQKVLSEKVSLTIGLERNEIFDFVEKTLQKKQVTEADLDQAVTYLLGRGKGLTPSGDDILVAYLFLMKLYHQERFNQLTPLILKSIQKTTYVSQAYLKACLDGYVSSVIYQLYQWLKMKGSDVESLLACLEQIQAIGHTSGSDMLFGIGLGLSFIGQNHRRIIQ